MGTRNIAKGLARKYGVQAKHVLYGELGVWYHHLRSFPAAFFDKNGYIVFQTKEDYENCPYLQLGQDVNITENGISSIPGYVLYKEKEEEKAVKEEPEEYKAQEASVNPESPTEFTEGAIEEMVVELRKRDPRLKTSAIEAFGTICQICGFDFSDVYGELGEGYIELHHIHPLSESDDIQQTTLDAVAMVCSNCHRMLHRNGKSALPIEELIKIVQAQKTARG